MFLENSFPADRKVKHSEDCIDYLQECLDPSGASQIMGVINISHISDKLICIVLWSWFQTDIFQEHKYEPV